MVKEEISIQELLDVFKVEIDLSEKLQKYIISGDFLKADLIKDGDYYSFKVDSVRLIVKPNDDKETISKLVYNDEDEVIGGMILGVDGIQYLN